MLAYAASRPAIAARRSSPHSLLFIASAHVVAIAFLVSARMDLPTRIHTRPTIVDLIKIPPKAVSPAPVPPPRGARSIDPLRVDAIVPIPTADLTVRPDPGPAIIPIVPGPSVDPLPPLPKPALGRTAPSLLTPTSELKPPYPRQKLILEEEASLTLRLSIDPSGRVVAVDPVGRADPVFLAVARRHLLAHWRYKPAFEDGHAVASSIVTTLHFRIDG